MNPLKFIGSALFELFGEDVVNNPRSEAKPMSPKQMYDYLVSQRRRTPEEQAMLEYLHKALGKDKWD